MKNLPTLTILACAALSAARAADASDVKLADLIAQSEVIVYGHVVRSAKDTQNSVTFVPQTVLKGDGIAANNALPLCNAVGAPDSFDLRAVSKGLIIFARSTAECLQPVHGFASVIAVGRGGLAETAALYDQPAREPVATFLGKIRHLLQSAR
jgi:hypothetical protein